MVSPKDDSSKYPLGDGGSSFSYYSCSGLHHQLRIMILVFTLFMLHLIIVLLRITLCHRLYHLLYSHVSQKEVTVDIKEEGRSSVKSFLHFTKFVASSH